MKKKMGISCMRMPDRGETLTVVMRLPEIDRQNRVVSVFSTEQDVGIYIDGVERIYYNGRRIQTAGSYSAAVS